LNDVKIEGTDKVRRSCASEGKGSLISDHAEDEVLLGSCLGLALHDELEEMARDTEIMASYQGFIG